MEQKATVEFDATAKTLTISGELLPISPGVHDALLALVQNPELTAGNSFDVERNVIKYWIRFAVPAPIAASRMKKAIPVPTPSAADLDAQTVELEVKEMTAADAAAEALKPHGA